RLAPVTSATRPSRTPISELEMLRGRHADEHRGVRLVTQHAPPHLHPDRQQIEIACLDPHRYFFVVSGRHRVDELSLSAGREVDLVVPHHPVAQVLLLAELLECGDARFIADRNLQPVNVFAVANTDTLQLIAVEPMDLDFAHFAYLVSRPAPENG